MAFILWELTCPFDTEPYSGHRFGNLPSEGVPGSWEGRPCSCGEPGVLVAHEISDEAAARLGLIPPES